MKYLLSLLLLVLGCTSVPTTPSNVDAAAIIGSRTVALVALDKLGQVQAFCSGVWVSHSEIMTAHHCVEDGGEYTYLSKSDFDQDRAVPHYAEVTVLDAAHDLALLRAEGVLAPHGIATFASVSSVEQGQTVHVMGHSLGLWWSFSSGHVASVREYAGGLDEPIWWIQVTAPISPGNSGGGLFDVDCNLIGIASRQVTRGQNLNFFVHRKYLQELLTKPRG